MKYIGNYSCWIKDQKVLEFLTSCKGDLTPVWQPDRWTGNPTLDRYRELARKGYSNNKHFFHQLNPNSLEIRNFEFELPDVPEKRSKVNWWFVILYPGEFQSMHIDPLLTEVSNPVRYTMFLQDWEPGHIFVYDDKVAVNYKVGDMFEWSDPMIVHGPANIGYNVRYTFQLTMYD